MPRAGNSIDIARSAEEVFDFLAKGENNLKWRPGVLEIEHMSGEGLGAVWRQRHRGPGGRPVASDYEITEYVRPTLLGFRAIAGPARPAGRYSLEPTGPGCRLTFTLWWEPKGLKRLMSGVVQKTMEAEVRYLPQLKSVLEAGD